MDLTSESVKEFLQRTRFKLRAMVSHGTTRCSACYKTKLGFLFNFDFVPLVGVNMSSRVDFKQNLFRN